MTDHRHEAVALDAAGQPKARRVFFNSIPKSGTHLLLQALSAVPGLRPPLMPPFYMGSPDQLAADRDRLGHLESGALAFGHVYYSSGWDGLLTDLGFARVFLYRDPRDMVASLVHYATRQEPDMVGLAHLSHCLHADRDRLLALITGFEHDGSAYPDIATFYRVFVPWRDDPSTLSVQFEELVGSPETRRSALARVLRLVVGETDHERANAAVAAMEEAINPTSSPTFRQGTTGAWRDEFDELTKRVFKAVTGSLLIDLGYETDDTW